jgi:GNAT superfamily N-acetyltransferase
MQSDLITRIQDLIDEYHFLAADVTEKLGASFLRSDRATSDSSANSVRRIRLQAEGNVDALFAELDRFYAHLPFRAVRTDPFTTPGSIEARLLLEGYSCHSEIIMAAEGTLSGKPGCADIETIRDDDGWAALKRLKAEDVGSTANESVALDRRRGEVFTWYLASVDGRFVGHLSQRTKDELGYLEDLFVSPEFRLRGIATALLHHAAEAARNEGARIIFLPCSAEDTPKTMYFRIGFRPIYTFRNYLKRVDRPASAPA